MTECEPENAGLQPHLVRLVDSLGDPNWRARHAAIEALSRDGSPDLIPHIVRIIREEHRDLSRLNAAIQVLTTIESDVVPALQPLLADSDPETRAYVAQTLGMRDDPRAIPELIKALSDPDANVRIHAIEALGKLRAAAAVDLMVLFVDSRDFEFALPALDALMAIGDERIAQRLFPLLHDALFQATAIEALGVLGDEEAVAVLWTLASDSTAPLNAIARAIQQIHDRQVARYGDGQSIIEIVRCANGASVPALRSAMSTSSVAERMALTSVIGWMTGVDAEAALLEGLESPELRGQCVDSLAARGAGVVPAVLQKLEDSPSPVQFSLIEICGRVADRRLVPALLRCLDSDDDEIVAKSFDALARIGDPQMYEVAKSFLGSPNASVRQAAVSALNSLGHPDTARDMGPLLSDNSPLECESALKVATYFGFPDCVDAVLACCSSPDERIRRTAIEHLPCLEDDRILSEFEKSLASDNARIRASLARALGEIDQRDAIPMLHRALTDGDVWVRYFAVRSLAQFPRSAETKALVRSMAKEDTAIQVRIAAVESLDSDAIDVLVELSDSDEDDLATAATIALGRTGHPEALPALVATIQSTHQRKSVEAIRALGKLKLAGAIAPLQLTARGRDPLLAEEAIGALGQIPLAESTLALLVMMETPSRRRDAIRALVNQGESAIPILAHRLQCLPLDVRLGVVEALIGVRSRGASELLESAVADVEPAVRHAALAALAHVRRLGRQISDAMGSKGDA